MHLSKESGRGPTEFRERGRKNLEDLVRPPSPPSSNIMSINKKRPTPKEDSGDEEKADSGRKKAKSNDEEEKKSFSTISTTPVGRVWCQEDEITVLEGMIDYKNKGVFPPNDMVAFHEFIKGKLVADISRPQMYENVKRMKKKFLINLEKVDDSIEPDFSKPHDYVLFGLSSKLWGRSSSRREDLKRKRKNRELRKNRESRKPVKGYSSYLKVVKKREDEKRKNEKSRKLIKGCSNFPKVVKEKEDATIDTRDFQSKYPYLSESVC